MPGVSGCPPAQQTAAKRGKPSLPPFLFTFSFQNRCWFRVSIIARLRHRASATTQRTHRTRPYPRVVGHRGGGALAPENTLAGIRKAAAMGFRGVEVDVMVSADKGPLLIHHGTLDPVTSRHGRVDATAHAKVARLDARGP